MSRRRPAGRPVRRVRGERLFIGAWAALSLAAADWEQFRGPGGAGISADADPPLEWSEEQNVVWKTPLPGAGASSPVIRGDRIFLTAATGFGPGVAGGGNPAQLKRHVLCLDAGSGRMLWSNAVAADLPEQEKIREDHGYASSTLAVDAERLYAFFGKSGVFAFDHTGRQLWRTRVGDQVHGWGSATSPVLCQDLVIVNASVESEAVVALDRATGREVWRTAGIKEAWNTPAIAITPAGEPELQVGMLRQVMGLDPATGRKRWWCDTRIDWYMCPSPVSHDGVVYWIGGRSGGGLAVNLGGRGDVAGSHLRWRLNKGSNVSSPVFHEGHLYFAHENLGVVYCVEAASGKVVYEERLNPNPGQIYASPILAAGRLYYVSRGGTTAVVAAAPKFRLLASNPLARTAGTFNASPVPLGRRLLLRSDRFLYCLGGN
ncbi:MAG: PQQ-binding-like beta-propeller repeat protein [Verrucomicrobiales bacterium]|nr:PQQ-binding-like beta-propeller repeat protein [Verrucomicrobiales bacterium]